MIKTVSLFCGCGGMDLGFVQAGYDIVWSNDFDIYATKTYKHNFKHKVVCEDINKVDLSTIPNHEVLIGGFPCQPFSMMGSSLGFEDTRGTLFFRIVEIIKNQMKRHNAPKVLVLENVRALKTHDKGKTFQTIKNIITKDLGYSFYDSLLNSADYGVPQTRNRTYMVAFLDHRLKYSFPNPKSLQLSLQDILENGVEEKYFLSDKIKKTILSNGSKNYKSKSEIDLTVARPLTATMSKMHRACQDNYITQEGRLRRLTPRECARLQGFPDDFVFPVSDAQAYKQLGNAVTVNVAKSVADSILATLTRKKNE